MTKVMVTADAGAVISPDGVFRYRLWRDFDIQAIPSLFPSKGNDRPPAHQGKRVLWIMLNPSTADGKEDDPTIRKCMMFSALWGYGGIDVVNLFAFRATKPQVLWESRKTIDIVGRLNDGYIVESLIDERVGKVVVAWGATGMDHISPRPELVMLAIERAGRRAYCLGKTKHGFPRHPLMLAYNTPLGRYKLEAD